MQKANIFYVLLYTKSIEFQPDDKIYFGNYSYDLVASAQYTHKRGIDSRKILWFLSECRKTRKFIVLVCAF